MNTQHRSKETEIMDDFNMEGQELKASLDNIAWINRILGGNKPVLKTIRQIAKAYKNETVSVVDYGCGNGDMLRAIASMGRKEGQHFKLQGVDANAYTIDYGKALSTSFPEISYACLNMLDSRFVMEPCDIILFTLTLHHFSDEEIRALLQEAHQKARICIVINDLQRSQLSYLLFGCLSTVFRLGSMNATDGRISILRGFKRKDLEQFSQKLQFKKYSIQWKWGFRYQWIISKL
jgi:2-polyprenyl-3-methyl-5-hydroxy-6-metoxy-1,4-benzoquinol methylase